MFIGFADAFLYLRDNKKFDEEVHKILARTVSTSVACTVCFVGLKSAWPRFVGNHLQMVLLFSVNQINQSTRNMLSTAMAKHPQTCYNC